MDTTDQASASLDSIRMLKLAHALAAAKSRRDVPAAMRCLHPEMTLRAPAFGSPARGRAPTRRR